MHRSINQLLSTVILSGTTLVSAGLFTAPASADILSAYQPAFLRQAERALTRGGAERAVKIIDAHREGTLRRHHRAQANGLLCHAHLLLDAPAEARAACARALELEQRPHRWRYLNNLGVAELRLGNYDAAQSAFADAKSISRGESAARRNLQLTILARETREAEAAAQVTTQRP